ncbi:MAG TPA: phosphonate ABC transporter, permease protein PhnE [Gaiellaceae bacterium]|nr:phosphonate ABC transporter, permease protein PhnE [Gaiellaceae bacterium]
MTTNAELSTGAATAARLSWGRLRKLVLTVLIAAVFVHAWTDTHISVSEFFSSFHNLVRLVGEMFPPSSGVLDSSIHAAILTFDTALLATAAAFVIALLLTPLAARNITPHRSVYEITRAVIGFLRSIPLLISGLLFLVVVGPTPFAGVLALTVETVGVLPKLYAEAIEEMDMGPVDALRVSGARRTQVFLHGVLPAVTPTFVGLVIYRMDSNVRSALVLSAFGAGGIGFLLYQSIELFQWQQVGAELIVMLVLVLLVERASIFIRSRIS